MMESILRPTTSPLTCYGYLQPQYGEVLDLSVRKETSPFQYTMNYANPKVSPKYSPRPMPYHPLSPVSQCSEYSDSSECSKVKCEELFGYVRSDDIKKSNSIMTQLTPTKSPENMSPSIPSLYHQLSPSSKCSEDSNSSEPSKNVSGKFLKSSCESREDMAKSPNSRNNYLSQDMSPGNNCSPRFASAPYGNTVLAGGVTRNNVNPFEELSKSHKLNGLSFPNPLFFEADASYQEFRKQMISRLQTNNECNKNMSRNQHFDANTKDTDYLEKRKRNNEAAKRSRDARKAKGSEIAIRLAYLEKQNLEFKLRISQLLMETNMLNEMANRKF